MASSPVRSIGEICIILELDAGRAREPRHVLTSAVRPISWRRGRRPDRWSQPEHTTRSGCATSPPPSIAGLDPVLVLHGFPSCSFDWRHVLERMRSERRVVLVDFIGFGLSDKPDLRYSLRGQADVVEAVAGHLGLDRVALVTHDMGDSVGASCSRATSREPRVPGQPAGAHERLDLHRHGPPHGGQQLPCSHCPTSATSWSAPTAASRSVTAWRPRSPQVTRPTTSSWTASGCSSPVRTVTR